MLILFHSHIFVKRIIHQIHSLHVLKVLILLTRDNPDFQCIWSKQLNLRDLVINNQDHTSKLTMKQTIRSLKIKTQMFVLVHSIFQHIFQKLESILSDKRTKNLEKILIAVILLFQNPLVVE